MADSMAGTLPRPRLFLVSSRRLLFFLFLQQTSAVQADTRDGKHAKILPSASPSGSRHPYRRATGQCQRGRQGRQLNALLSALLERRRALLDLALRGRLRLLLRFRAIHLTLVATYAVRRVRRHAFSVRSASPVNHATYESSLALLHRCQPSCKS